MMVFKKLENANVIELRIFFRIGSNLFSLLLSLTAL